VTQPAAQAASSSRVSHGLFLWSVWGAESPTGDGDANGDGCGGGGDGDDGAAATTAVVLAAASAASAAAATTFALAIAGGLPPAANGADVAATATAPSLLLAVGQDNDGLAAAVLAPALREQMRDKTAISRFSHGPTGVWTSLGRIAGS